MKEVCQVLDVGQAYEVMKAQLIASMMFETLVGSAAQIPMTSKAY